MTADSKQKWAALALILFGGIFLIALDFNIVNVSIPAIRAGLHANFAEVDLVLAAYGIAFAVALITGSRLGDLFGRKRVLLIGEAVFACASLACGLSPSPFFLIIARVFQGLGAALMLPQVLSLIQIMFQGKERQLAISFFGMTIGLGNICGNIIGGALAQANLFGLEWRPIFLLNLPVIILVSPLIWKWVTESRAQSCVKLDLIGAGLISVAIGLLIYPLAMGRQENWPFYMWIFLAAGAVLLFIFTRYEKIKSDRHESPLIEISIFYNKKFTLGLLVGFFFFLIILATLLLLTLYMQMGLHFDERKTGLMFSPFGAAFLIASLLSSKLVQKLGKYIVHLGTTIMMIGIIWLIVQSRRQGADITTASILIGLITYGTGQGFTQPPLLGLILSGIKNSELVGSASGILSTVQQMSMSLGIAVIGTIYFTFVGSNFSTNHYVEAFGNTLFVILGLLGLTFLLAFALPSEKTVKPANHSI
ncbi:MAG: transporter [Bacteriovoracaceae bacterium]|nr:transporter [Bacteriovoracaceae bacterium]